METIEAVEVEDINITEESTDSFKWSHKNTLIFLDLYQKYRKKVGSLKCKSLKKMYEAIAKEMQLLTKLVITASNCENKWRVLERNFKKYNDNNKKTGRGRKDFEYADIMYEILGHKKNINPEILLSSSTISHMRLQERSEDETGQLSVTLLEDTIGKENINDFTPVRKTSFTNATDLDSTSTVPSSTPRKIYNNKKLRYDVLQEIRNDRKEYYKQRLNLEERKLEEKKIKNKILQERNELIKQALEKRVEFFNLC